MTWRDGIWSWTCPVYRTSFVLVRCPRPEAPALLRREIPYADVVDQMVSALDPAKTNYRGQFIFGAHPEHGDIAVIWLDPIAGVDTLAHEIVHVLTAVLAERGMHLCDASEEAFAYYMGWLVRESLARLAGAAA